jgi:hypothetical protein
MLDSSPFAWLSQIFFDERDEDEVEVEAAGGRRRRSRRSLWDERTGPNADEQVWSGDRGEQPFVPRRVAR